MEEDREEQIAINCFSLAAEIIRSAIPSRNIWRPDFYKFSVKEIRTNINFIKNSYLIDFFCDASESLQPDELRRILLEDNYNFLKKYSDE